MHLSPYSTPNFRCTKGYEDDISQFVACNTNKQNWLQVKIVISETHAKQKKSHYLSKSKSYGEIPLCKNCAMFYYKSVN